MHFDTANGEAAAPTNPPESAPAWKSATYLPKRKAM